MSKKVGTLGFCGIALVWFPDDLLWIATCRNFQCDIIIQISKEQFCVFYLLSVVNQLSIMHGMNGIFY
jgi:hypothetical protein